MSTVSRLQKVKRFITFAHFRRTGPAPINEEAPRIFSDAAMTRAQQMISFNISFASSIVMALEVASPVLGCIPVAGPPLRAALQSLITIIQIAKRLKDARGELDGLVSTLT